ncbi:ABC transporter substrate-binding protein [Rubrivivax gelatinosus]|uniref:Bicyclomycin resistance protein n=2 Tax=Rubrivivax gelatinosus TaxID=28068 RepID=A0ABS1DVM0_RUBGE|nr:ABC transporter substrate-binding protein [Rubrivivax gelatinosus]MBK1714082.1 bicyclomycin resistance protein [Rubrivivax gelatinosus]
MKRLVRLATLAACLFATGTVALAQPAAAAPKTLRYSFPIAETGFDPVPISDLYSLTVVAGIFEAPLEFAFLARPVRMRPNTAAAMPEVSADFRTFTFRIKPGIYFAADPAFKGKRRELVAADYVYSVKRHYDPRGKAGRLYRLESAKILGLSELRARALKERKPFDYDAPVEGLRTLDRYTFQVKLAEPSPRFLYVFADGSLTGAVAREVVEFYGDRIGEHPVGTGPFKLGAWKRSSSIVLERNPGYREVLYDEEAPAGDERLQAVVREFKGRRLPLVDRVQISIIEEPQPRWLSFLNEEQDVAENVPAEFANVAFPNNELAPNLAKRGILMLRYPRSDVAYSYFAMENPVVGGYEPHKVALRRAIALAVDVEREIRLVRGGQAVPAQSIVGPESWGFDAAYKSEMGDYDPARAKALLDMHGYVDRDGDGWREQPDGSPLLLEYSTQPDQQSRKLTELWKKNMDAIGIRIVFKAAKWPEQLKASRAGKLMMWGVGWSAEQPDGDTFLAVGYGPNKGQSNHARFDMQAFNALYEKQAALPDGPERQAAMDAAKKLMIAYMPYKVHVHRIWTDLAQPWVSGYSRNIFVREFWKYVDIDREALARRGS